MKKMKLLSFLLAMVMCLSACNSQGQVSPAVADDYEQETTENHLPVAGQLDNQVAQEGNILSAASGISLDSVIMRINKETIRAEEYLYWLTYMTDYLMDYYRFYTYKYPNIRDEMVEGTTYAEYLKSAAEERTVLFAVIRQWADSYGLVIDDEDSLAIDTKYLEEITNMGAEQALLDDIAKMGLTKESYYRLMENQILYQKLQNLISDETSELYPGIEKVTAWCSEKGYITADHILIKTTDLEENDINGRDARKAKAEELLKEILASANTEQIFIQLAETYSDDFGRESFPQGYTFSQGKMEASFEEAAFSLKEGELAPYIVESSYGFHIIMRKPLNHIDPSMLAEYLDEMLSEACYSADIEYTEEYETLDVAAFYETLSNLRQGMDT